MLPATVVFRTKAPIAISPTTPRHVTMPAHFKSLVLGLPTIFRGVDVSGHQVRSDGAWVGAGGVHGAAAGAGGSDAVDAEGGPPVSVGMSVVP